MNKETFLSKYIVANSGCWEWQGATNPDGYGRARWPKKAESAHRISYEIFNGTFDKTKHVCHKCDNPKCINPEHLWLGDYKSNNKDKKDKGRAVGHAMPGTQHPKHKLNDNQVLEIFYGSKSHHYLAGLYNVSPTLVYKIKAKKCWKHLTANL